MLSSNKNIDQLQELAQDLFRRVQLQKRYVQLDIVKKLTILLSAFVIGAVVFLLGAIVVLYLSYLCVLLFTDWLGSVAGACGLVCLVFVVLAAVFYAEVLIGAVCLQVSDVVIESNKKIVGLVFRGIAACRKREHEDQRKRRNRY